MSAFAEDDARLAAMHGYAGLPPKEQPTGGDATLLQAIFAEKVENRLEAKLDLLTTLVRDLIHAMQAGAVGRWT